MKLVLFIGIAFEVISTLWTLGVSVENGSLNFEDIDCDGSNLYYNFRDVKYVAENAKNIEYIGSEGIDDYIVDWPIVVRYPNIVQFSDSIRDAPLVSKFECDELPGYSLFLKKCGIDDEEGYPKLDENILNLNLRMYKLEHDGIEFCQFSSGDGSSWGVFGLQRYAGIGWFKLSMELSRVILFVIIGSFFVEMVEFYLEFYNSKKRVFILVIQSLIPAIAAPLLFTVKEFFNHKGNEELGLSNIRKDTLLCITLIVLVIFTSVVGFILGILYARNTGRARIGQMSDALIWFSGTCLECTLLIFTEFRSKNTFQFSDISDSVIALLALEVFSLLLIYIGKFCWKKVKEIKGPSKISITEMV